MIGGDPIGMGPELSPEVARAIQRDEVVLAQSRARFNLILTLVISAALAFVSWGSMIPGVQVPLMSAAVSFRLMIAMLCGIALTVQSWREYRKARAILESVEFTSSETPHRPSVVVRYGSRFLVLLLLAFAGHSWWVARGSSTGPIVFRNATLMTSTGFLQEHMTIAIADGRIAFVGAAGDEEPRSISGARRIDALEAQVSAATFDRSVAAPLEGLRHIWAGQLFAGAPGDVVITPVPVRGRGGRGGRGGGGGGGFGGGAPREILGAVVSGRYYSAAELRAK